MHEDKRLQGAVSLWVGISTSQDALENYVDMDYTTGDSSHLSRLAKDFGTGWYDHDFMDTSFREKPTQFLSDLLRRCSYASLIVPKFVELCGEVLPTESNSAVLLYNFQHSRSVRTWGGTDGSVTLRYMGSIMVEMPWPD